jgi:hypothetical protein
VLAMAWSSLHYLVRATCNYYVRLTGYGRVH